MKFFKPISMIFAVALFGCAQPQVPGPIVETSVVKTNATQKPAAADPSLVVGSTWTMNLVKLEDWKKVSAPEDLSNEVKVEFLAVSKEKEFDGLPIILQVLSSHHSVGDSEFIKSVLSAQLESEGTKIIKIKGVDVASGESGVLVMLSKVISDHLVIVFQLITSKEGAGYVVSCGSGASGVKEFAPVCFDSMSTFTLKPSTKSKPAAKPVKMPASSPQSTQTLNDTSL